jgi:CheY-like chemotaxis protein
MAARILVADDDEDTRDLVAMALRGPGIEIVFAVDAPELLAQAADAGPFDVIVTDINMPGVAGLGVLGALRAVDATTPVLVVTALTHPDPTEPVARMGNSFLLHKPFGIEQLRNAIKRLRGLAP